MLITFKNKSTIEKLKGQMKDLGEAKRILGMEIERHGEGKVSLTQKAYLQKVLQKFNIGSDTKSVSVSLALYFKLSAKMSPKRVDERECMSYMPYGIVVNSLIYA